MTEEMQECARWCVRTWRRLSFPVKVMTSMAVLLSSIAGAIIAVPAAWTAAELPQIASRNWTAEQIQAISGRISAIELAQAGDRRKLNTLREDVLRGQKTELEIKLRGQLSDDARPFIEEKLRQINAALSEVEREREELRKQPVR